ncbi:NUDIX hydrolase [Micromonospora sp. NPDC005174]|uniref:NUDIX hydrolase n=1 Tax=Micromonospora sp. NPDC005174 TaxID=3157018 RepID=UPI0033ADE947
MTAVQLLVGALVVDADEFLLLRRSERETFLPGRWGIPAGKVKPGEDLKVAVLRELREEAGLAGTVECSAGSVWFDSVRDGQPWRNLQVNYVVRPYSRQVQLDHSNSACAWVSLADMTTSPVEVDAFTRRIVEMALQAGPAGHAPRL